MEAIEYLLLAEGDGPSIMDTIRATLDIKPSGRTFLIVNGDGYELVFCVVSNISNEDTAAFFNRQIERIYDYYDGIFPASFDVKARALKQIELSESLVIMQYTCEEEEQGTAERKLDDITKILLGRYCGLLLADSGHKLLNQDLLLVFSDEGTFEVSDFEPCKNK